jgi:hypothetical protein
MAKARLNSVHVEVEQRFALLQNLPGWRKYLTAVDLD